MNIMQFQTTRKPTSITLFFSALITLLLNGSGLHAQQASAYLVTDSKGDYQLNIDVGTQDDPIFNASEIQITIGYEGFTLSEGQGEMLAVASNSWFGGDGNYGGSLSIDEENNELTLNMFRTDATNMSGYGYVASGGGGVIIEIDILHKMQPVLDVKSVTVNTGFITSEKPILIHRDRNADRIFVTSTKDDLFIEGLAITDMAGNVIQQVGGNEISLQWLYPGELVVLRIYTNDGTFNEKIIK
ncbi:MAG: hypothetical protein AAGI38_10430 [Bacteroidota bacterium]